MKMIHRIALATVALLGFATAAPASAATCSVAPTTGSGSYNGTLALVPLGFTGRWYSLHVPAGIAPGSKAPLMIDLHGAGESEDIAEMQTGWSPFADQQKFIVAYGQAQGTGNGGTFWNAYTANSSDTQYLKDVADDIAKKYCVDPKRIYIEGFSNGGVMAQRAACDAAGKFAAVASHAGATPTTGGAACNPSRPIGVWMDAGDQDTTQASTEDEAARDMWIAKNSCTAPPLHTTDTYGVQDTYAGCSAGAQVVWRILTNTSHQWPTGAAGDDLHSRIWAFLMSHTLP